MRWEEIVGGIRVPLSKAESEIVARADKNPIVVRDLKPAEQEMTRKLVVRGVLNWSDDTTQTKAIKNVDPSVTRF